MILIRSTVMGFCAGVQAAVIKVNEALEQGERMHLPVYTIGPLIHNPSYMSYLEEQGVSVIETPKDAPVGIAVIRAHGIPAINKKQFEKAGFRLIDGTCSRVINSQRIVHEYSMKHWSVVLAGDPGHAEVYAVAGAAEVPKAVCVVHDPRDLDKVDLDKPLVLLSQTTFSREKFSAIADILSDRVHRRNGVITVIESICPSTANRQNALYQLCSRVDAIVVIGGKNSSNTRRLYELAIACGKRSWLINGVEEVTSEMLCIERLGITAGASTPAWLIKEIEDRLQNLHEADTEQ